MSDKVQYEMEFEIKSSTHVLFNMISTPSGLSEWFADNVNIKKDLFTFIWDGSEEEAKMISKKADDKIRFQWKEDEGEDYYFELRIQVDEITKDVSLMITDFSDDDDIEENKMLWDNQISDLKKILGSV